MSVRYLRAWSDPPSGWTFEQSVRLLSPDGRASVVVANEPVDAGVDADDFARVSLASMQREFPGFELQQEGRTFFRGISDVPWYQVAWIPLGGRRTKQLQVYAVQDSRGFAITATCADDDWDEFEEPFWETIANAIIPDAIPAGTAGERRGAVKTERRIFDSDRRDDRSTDRDEGFGGRAPSRTDGITIPPPAPRPELPAGEMAYPGVSKPGQPPSALPVGASAQIYEHTGWDVNVADPIHTDEMPEDAIDIRTAMTSTPTGDWVAAGELTLTGPERVAPHGTIPPEMELTIRPDGKQYLTDEQPLQIVARRIRRNSIDPDPFDVPLLARMRVLHRRLLPDHPAAIAAEWVKVDSTDAVLDRFSTGHDGPMTAFQLAAELGDDEGLIVTASAPAGRADIIAELGLPVALSAHVDPFGSGLRWVRTPQLTVHECLHFATRDITAFAELREWSSSPDVWRDQVLNTGPFLRGAVDRGDRVVEIDGFGDVRLEQFEWQPSGSGRRITSIGHGVAHNRAFWFALEVSVNADDASATDPGRLLRSISIDPKAW